MRRRPDAYPRPLTALLAATLAAALAVPSGAAEDPTRLEADEPNSIVYRHSRGDDNAARGKVSLRYWFSAEPDRVLYFKFTTEFDFYVPETRDSSPVIGRAFNPGVLWREPLRPEGGRGLSWIEGGLEHRSNGQATDVGTPAGRAAAQAAYAAGERAFFDTVSRSSHYAVVGARLDFAGEHALIARTKFHFSTESDVTWGPRANEGLNLRDFDRHSVRYLYRERGLPALDVEWTFGNGGLRSSSLNLGAVLCEAWGVPLYLRAHSGPLNTLANYHERQSMVGLGVQFRPWK